MSSMNSPELSTVSSLSNLSLSMTEGLSIELTIGRTQNVQMLNCHTDNVLDFYSFYKLWTQTIDFGFNDLTILYWCSM